MADGNPFSDILGSLGPAGVGTSQRSIFEPSGATSGPFDPFAFAGRLMGVPTTSERYGRIQAEALQDLNHYVSQGKTPQQAIGLFIDTPRGQNLFASGDPNAFDVFDKFIKAWTPPAPTGITTGAGQTTQIWQGGKQVGTQTVPPTETQNYRAGVPQLVPPGYTQAGQGGPQYTAPTTEQQNVNVPKPTLVPPGYQPAIAQGGTITPQGVPVPPTEVQTFQHFARNIPPAVVQELERLHALPPDQRPAAIERALDSLVVTGRITLEQKNKAMLIQVSPAFNEHGDRIGTQIFDPTTMQSIIQTGTIPGPKGVPQPIYGGPTPAGTVPQAQPQPAAPGPQTAAPAPQQPQVAAQPQDPNEDMFLAAGMTPGLFNLATNVAQGINPGLQTDTTQQMQSRTNKIAQLREAVMGMKETSPRLRSVADAVLGTIPTTGITSNSAPYATTQGIQMYDKLVTQWQKDATVARDLSKPNKLRIDAKEDMQHIENVLARLPRRESMITSLQEMDARGMTLPQAAKEIIGLGRGIKQTVTGPSKADAQAAETIKRVQTMTEPQLQELWATAKENDALRKAIGVRAAEILRERNQRPVEPTPQGPGTWESLKLWQKQNEEWWLRKRRQQGREPTVEPPLGGPIIPPSR